MQIRSFGWWALAAMLGACGGGDATFVAPSGLQIGFFQETEPNPTPASFYVYLPAGDGSYTGGVSAKYVDCQPDNVLSVTGTRTAEALSGSWSGTLDGTPLTGTRVEGTLSGRYDRSNLLHTGSYTTTTGGDVSITRCDSVSYTFAASGTWELVAVGAKMPSIFEITVADSKMQWNEPSGATRWLVRVYDESLAQRSDSTGVVQQVVQANIPGTTDQEMNLASLTPGRDYVLAVTAFNTSNLRAGYTSMRYRAPAAP